MGNENQQNPPHPGQITADGKPATPWGLQQPLQDAKSGVIPPAPLPTPPEEPKNA